MASVRAVVNRREPQLSQSRVGWKPGTVMLSGLNRKPTARNVSSAVADADPCPEIPETFVDPTRILKLAREIHAVAAGQDGVVEPEPAAESAAENVAAAARYTPPTILTRQVVASRRRWPDFAPLVAQAARMAG